MNEVRQSLGEIPIVEDELRKAAGEEQMEDESVAATANQGVQKLVTADGTYATQSAFSGGETDNAKGQQEKVVDLAVSYQFIKMLNDPTGETTTQEVSDGGRLFHRCLIGHSLDQVGVALQQCRQERHQEAEPLHCRDHVGSQLNSSPWKVW